MREAESMKPILITFAIFLIAFVGVRHLAPDGILLYQGVGLGLFICIGQFTRQKRRRGKRQNEPLKDALLSFLLIYAFVFTVPTTVDRAYSVRMIGHLAQAPTGSTRAAIDALYVEDFVHGGGVEKRLKEQLATGVISEDKGLYRLTSFGLAIELSFQTVRKLFKCGEPSR